MSTLLKSHVASLAGRTVLVIGDVALDEYITGRVMRMSREAPVPVLELESKRYIAGGAANPAATIVSLGGRAIQVGIVGEDAPGEQLRQLLVDQGIDARGILRRADRPTTVKTRILAQMGLRFPQQVTPSTRSHASIDGKRKRRWSISPTEKLADVNAVLLSLTTAAC